jgi:hypothetical protein
MQSKLHAYLVNVGMINLGQNDTATAIEWTLRTRVENSSSFQQKTCLIQITTESESAKISSQWSNTRRHVVNLAPHIIS